MHHHIKHRRTISVTLTAEDIYRLTGMEPETRIIIGSVRQDGDRGVIVEIIETAQVIEREVADSRSQSHRRENEN